MPHPYFFNFLVFVLSTGTLWTQSYWSNDCLGRDLWIGGNANHEGDSVCQYSRKGFEREKFQFGHRFSFGAGGHRWDHVHSDSTLRLLSPLCATQAFDKSLR